jgi:anti-anti-sigma factor
MCPMFREDAQGVVHIQGELTIHGLEPLRLFLTDLLHSNKEPVLSLAEVTFIDTAALQLLVACRNSLPASRSWRVVAVSEQVERILTLCGLKKALLAQEG